MNALLRNNLDRWEKFRILCRVRRRGMEEIVRYLRSPNSRITAWLLCRFGACVGERTTFKGAVIIDNVYQDRDSAGDLSHLKIGVNCYIGEEVYFDLASQIVIGENAVISGHVSLVTHADCNRSPAVAARFPRKSGPVVVGSGAWIGFGATVLCGVEIGAEAVIGAGSLVTRSVVAGAVCAGTPARPVEKRA
jgi:acetyltransferase-like isoleucine patch superfamily enzyme